MSIALGRLNPTMLCAVMVVADGRLLQICGWSKVVRIGQVIRRGESVLNYRLPINRRAGVVQHTPMKRPNPFSKLGEYRHDLVSAHAWACCVFVHSVIADFF